MKNKSSFRSKVLRMLIGYNILFIIVTTIFCVAIPKLLIYPPLSINTEFELNIDDGFRYNDQCFAIVAFAMLASNIALFISLRKIKGWNQYVGKDITNPKDLNRLEYIKKSCYRIPSRLYILHAVAPPLVTALGLFLTGTKAILTTKISVVLLMLFFTIGLLIYVFSKNLLAGVLRELENSQKYDLKLNINSYKSRMFLQILPLVLLMGTYIYLITDAVEIEEKGDILFDKYYAELQEVGITESKTVEEIKEKLSKIEKEYPSDTVYIITRDSIIYQDSDEEISDFYRTYTWFWDDIHHTYGYYASSIQGAFDVVNIDGVDYAAGVMYYAQAHDGYAIIFSTFLIISILIIVFIVFFAGDISRQISSVSEYMRRLANDEVVDYDQKLAVTTNDEIGDLTINFNKILDKEKQYVETIKQNQEVLIENERLSSLGQLIGGIAHNLKTPIMSVSGYLTAIEDLSNEYKNSIGNPSVTKQDYEDITKEMQGWIDKSKYYLNYMTEVINAAKGQAVSMNANTAGSFTAKELIARTKILMMEELKKYNCDLNVELNINENTDIIGELSAIVQVLDNLITNAMQAYGEQKGNINLILNEDKEKVYIHVQDFAGGIPEHIKDKLFKEMITTKGKDGTGLGLYMCYSTIKGKFGGDMNFESETGKGTTFNIVLNKKK